MIKKVKNAVRWTYVISDFNGEEIFWTFNEKELQKSNQKWFRVEKEIKKRWYMLIGNAVIILLIAAF